MEAETNAGAPMSPPELRVGPDLLAIARETGLREVMFGVNATEARALLMRFFVALPDLREANEVLTQIRQIVRPTVDENMLQAVQRLAQHARTSSVEQDAPRDPIPLATFREWFATRLKACGPAGVTCIESLAEDVMRWTELRHEISFDSSACNASCISWMAAQGDLKIQTYEMVMGKGSIVEILDGDDEVIGNGATLQEALADAMGSAGGAHHG